MGNEAEEKREDERLSTKKKKKKKEVFITVYVESPPPPHPIDVDDRDLVFKERNKSRQLFISKKAQYAAKTRRGYDRRADLLAYARELRRNVDAKRPKWPKTESKIKQKENPKSWVKWDEKLKTPVRIRRRYQRLVPKVDISCRPKSIILEYKKKSGGRDGDKHFRFATFLQGKLKRVLRGFCRE